MMFAQMVRIYIDGKDNVLADVPSRAPWVQGVVRQIPVPDKPVRDLVRLFFTHPREMEAEMQRVSTERKSRGFSVEFEPVGEGTGLTDLKRPRTSTPVECDVAVSGVQGKTFDATPRSRTQEESAGSVPGASTVASSGEDPAETAEDDSVPEVDSETVRRQRWQGPSRHIVQLYAKGRRGG